MNEQNAGTFNIFGDGNLDLGSEAMPDPFAESSAAPTEESAPEPTLAAPAPIPTQEATTPAAPQPQQQAAEATQTAPPENPLAAAVAKAEEKQVAVTADALFSKPPVFEHAGATEDIADASITFDQLRIEKAKDFPELEDGKRVSWTMEYCTIVKAVPTPDKTVISALKKEIENSKAFLDALKKAKDKNTVCKVKPKITAQSKGIASYKGIFTTFDEAEASDKLIRILPARDGNVYEMRCTEAGRFIARAENIPELSQVSAGFVPALPPVPLALFLQLLSFFRYYRETEVMAYICWDKQNQEYAVSVPMQKVGKAQISVIIPPDEAIDTDRYIHLADIHSHNSMPAFFSKTDDRDELATRVYIVVGRLDTPTPEICTRISVGRRFVPIPIQMVIDIPLKAMDSSGEKRWGNLPLVTKLHGLDNDCAFPQEWLSMVNVASEIEPGASYEQEILLPRPNRPLLLNWLMGRLRIRGYDNEI